MAQEFTIKSADIESKINQLLPSQGGQGAGVDFSASTMVIPVVDLTETAEGSSLRQDLQTSLSLNSITTFSVANATTTLVSTTGYYRVNGVVYARGFTGQNRIATLQLTDGTTTKNIFVIDWNANTADSFVESFDFNVFISAGDSLVADSNNGFMVINGSTRQIADINGNLVNP